MVFIPVKVGLGRLHHPPVMLHHPPLIIHRPRQTNTATYQTHFGIWKKWIRRHNNQRSRQKIKAPTKKLQPARPRTSEGIYCKQTISNGHKESLIEAYAILMKSIDKKWKQPFYKRYDKLPIIPTTQQLNILFFRFFTRVASVSRLRLLIVPSWQVIKRTQVFVHAGNCFTQPKQPR